MEEMRELHRTAHVYSSRWASSSPALLVSGPRRCTWCVSTCLQLDLWQPQASWFFEDWVHLLSFCATSLRMLSHSTLS
jgi:hypothetical protein